MRSFFLALIYFFAVSSILVEAALLPAGQQKLEADFLSRADTRAVLSFVKTDADIFCGIKSVLKTSCQCTCIYQVERILAKPDSLALKAKDQIALNYPCDAEKNMNWAGNFMPWLKPEKGGLLSMSIPAKYLVPQGGCRWQLNNQENIFAPAQRE